MADYYREPAPFPSVPSGQQLYGAAIRNVEDGTDNPADACDLSAESRQCSVRGCGAPLPAGYTHKMCETCRGRHRTYASTKRAKRKMEKAALGMGSQSGQVVWMPPDDTIQSGSQKDTSAANSSHRGPRTITEPLVSVPNDSPNFEYHSPPLGWDPGVIDPALMPPGSEQAFAPEESDSVIPQGSESPFPHGPLPTQISHEYELSRALEPLSSSRSHHRWQQDGLQHVSRTTAGEENGFDSNGTPGPSTVLPNIEIGSVPPRYCSIKGCRALVSGSSFFKMCEPCRDRYRNYGTTKRAKWKREKEVVVAELQKIRDEEDRHRAEQGLPPLDRSTPTEWREWHAEGTPQTPPGFELAPTPSVPLAPRMCTVSHCREILPGGHQYLRCERHRIQNRHHSRLKRVRDKEVKAQAFDGWAATAAFNAAFNARGTSELSRDGSAEASALDTSMDHEDRDADGEDYDTGGHEYSGSANESASLNGNTITGPSSSLVGVDTPFGEPSSGVPPAARGTRRTNHVCSIKSCYNLLAPTNPWKMCDQCRERDRKVRREKALRDSGIITTPPPRAPRVPKAPKPSKDKDGGPGTEGAPKKKKKKKKKQVEVAPVEQPDAVASGKESAASAQDVPNPNPTPSPVSTSEVTIDANNFSADVEPAAVTSDPQPPLIFMNPLLPDSIPDPATSPAPSNAQRPTAFEESAAPSAVADQFHVVSVEQIVSRGAQSAAAAPGSKRAGRRKKAQPTPNDIPSDPATAEESSHPVPSAVASAPDPPTATSSTPQPLEGNGSGSPPAAPVVLPPMPVTPIPATNEAPPPGMTPMPPYMPYYMPSYGMTPYGAQTAPYPYGPYSYSRPPYGPGPIYQPPYSPYGQPYAYPQAYAQPYGPPPSAQPMYSVSSDFVSRADYAAASQSAQQGQTSYSSPAGASGSPYYSTFSARTGEPHVRSTPTPFTARRKRHLDQGSEASTSGANKRQTTAVEESPETNTSAPAVATSSAEPSSANETGTPIHVNTSSSAKEPDRVQLSPQATCSNKTCHRTLPQNTSGTLCARCKERLKKRQVKVKQRFRLEPRRSLLGRPGSDANPPQSISSANEGLVTATA